MGRGEDRTPTTSEGIECEEIQFPDYERDLSN
jgi:hypothetical protein